MQHPYGHKWQLWWNKGGGGDRTQKKQKTKQPLRDMVAAVH